MRRLNPRLRPEEEELLHSAVTEILDHSYSVTLHVTPGQHLNRPLYASTIAPCVKSSSLLQFVLRWAGPSKVRCAPLVPMNWPRLPSRARWSACRSSTRRKLRTSSWAARCPRPSRG